MIETILVGYITSYLRRPQEYYEYVTPGGSHTKKNRVNEVSKELQLWYPYHPGKVSVVADVAIQKERVVPIMV